MTQVEQGDGATCPPAPILVDTMTAAVAVAVRPGTIRSWQSRGLIRRVDTDRKGRAMYDLQEVMDAAERKSKVS